MCEYGIVDSITTFWEKKTLLAKTACGVIYKIPFSW